MSRCDTRSAQRSRVSNSISADREPRIYGLAPNTLKYRPLETHSTVRVVVLCKGSGPAAVECQIRDLTPVEGLYRYPQGWNGESINSATSIQHLRGFRQAHLHQYDKNCRRSLNIDTEFYESRASGDYSLYEILSYEWCNFTDGHETILVDRCRIQIRKNLFSAPQELRHVDKNRHLWCDALSVDRANIPEKDHQVGMIGDIFQKAENLVTWLGQAYHDSNTILDSLNKSGPSWNETILLEQHLCQADAS